MIMLAKPVIGQPRPLLSFKGGAVKEDKAWEFLFVTHGGVCLSFCFCFYLCCIQKKYPQAVSRLLSRFSGSGRQRSAAISVCAGVCL